MKLELFVKTRYYVMPDLWYRLGGSGMRFVRIGTAPDAWKFDRVRRLFLGLWRNVGDPELTDHLQYQRVGE